MTAPGTRRPREGRCERCDRPLSDLVWTTWTPITLCGPELPPITDWREETPTDDTRCLGEPLCSGVEIDWRARAIAAEESVTVCKAMISQLVGDLDGMRDQYRRGYTNGHAAGRQAAYDGEEPKGYGQALRDMTARALAAESRLSVPATSADTTRLHRIRARLLELVPADGTMSLCDDVQRLDRALADAEARGRAHGLLAAAMWVLGEMDRYERAHGGLPVVKWPVLDRGYRLALGNMLAALAIIDPMHRVEDDGSRFCATEANDAD